jgi:alpha-L-rhamnosidase
MKITACKTNHIVNPLGFMMKNVTFSWITEDTASKKQTAAQIKVASDEGLSNILYDSGKSEDISSLAAKIPVEPISMHTIFLDSAGLGRWGRYRCFQCQLV